MYDLKWNIPTEYERLSVLPDVILETVFQPPKYTYFHCVLRIPKLIFFFFFSLSHVSIYNRTQTGTIVSRKQVQSIHNPGKGIRFFMLLK